MSREKQIKSTDWLTRGIPKEQLEREKREAIMSADLQECITYDEWSAREYGHTSIEFDVTAEKMVAKGYLKQSEGEWIGIDICCEDMYCSVCGGIAPVDCEKEAFYKSNYCPQCGAKMKGDAE